jgi:hypothetical protein
VGRKLSPDLPTIQNTIHSHLPSPIFPLFALHNRRKIVRIGAEKSELIDLLEIVILFAPQSSDCAD